MNHCSDTLDPQDTDAMEIISILQCEQLLVSTEKKQILALNKQIALEITELLQTAWINAQQRMNLHSLIAGRADFSPVFCCKHAHSLGNTIFKHAKEVLDYQVMLAVSDLMRVLYDNHEQLAVFLVNGERIIEDSKEFLDILHSLVFGLSSCFILPEDKTFILNLLQDLARLQLVNSENPRKLLQQGSCTFATLYRIFHDGLPAARLFLIACLRNPIINLIATVDVYLDIDFNKMLIRFSQEEKYKKFGSEGTADYDRRILDYRKWVVAKLVEITNSFINSLQEHLVCFPEPLKWLMSQVAIMMSKNFTRPLKEVYAVCADLIFTLFICPAIIHPEPYGIYDAPISDANRHNLMQIGQILQILAMAKFESPERKLMDMHNKFDGSVISNIVDNLILKLDDAEQPLEKVSGICKSYVLFTEEELYNIVTFLQKLYNNSTNEVASNDVSMMSYNCNGNAASFTADLLSSLTRLNGFCDRFPKFCRPSKILKLNTPKRTILEKVTKNPSPTPSSLDELDATVVMIVPMKQDHDIIGLLPEYKVLKMRAEKDIASNEEQVANGITATQEKRIKFSQSNDEGSIGNTSDNLEVISEAASNHSVDSSIEMENEDQNDNLSDMISANVSGRGSPNISGRDTPSSQVNENDESRPAESRQQHIQNPPARMDKQIRSEIDDKFCKFEIKKLLEGDETISIISDTWSTDVLASDSETIDANDRNDQHSFAPIMEHSLEPPISNQLLDLSETQSESAWSTDVLASDNDDAISVAPSDDSASVTRSETVEESQMPDVTVTSRRMSSPSPPNNFQQPILKPTPVNNHENGAFSYSSSNMHDYRRVEITANINRILKSDPQNSQNNNLNSLNEIRHVSNHSYEQTVTAQQETRYKQNHNLDALDGKLEERKFEENSNDILLSNSSLNSSYSSGSNSSENHKNHANNSQPTHKWTTNRQWMNSSESSLNITSTPSESISELSVLSVNSLVSPMNNLSFLNRKTSALNHKMAKPSTTTGAIPKSISFDMSAEKGDKNFEEDPKAKRGGSFFGKLRMGMTFKNRRGKSFRGPDDFSLRYDVTEEDAISAKKNNGIGENSKQIPNLVNSETSDDILAKYRSKPGTDVPIDISLMDKPLIMEESLPIDAGVDSNLFFLDTKKKLRLVLSNTNNLFLITKKDGKKHVKDDLESYLQMELAKAKNLKHWSAVARISDALRCVRLLGTEDCHKMCNSLKEDYNQRLVYTRYLFNAKQTLLLSRSYIEGLREQIDCEREVCYMYFVTACARLILERYESPLQHFCDEFLKLTLADEKNDYLNNFLKQLYNVIERDSIWQDSSEEQMEKLKIAIEQSVMTAVYIPALFPNGDGDRDRDKVLYEHLQKLSSIITPSNKYLLINKMYLNECPWIPAQEALEAMAAYRTPRDKVKCIFCCTTSIMDLLSIAQDRGSITADDFTPVLVYVIIKTNPENLLSTIQYVNSFYSSQLSGEEEYWWTQFCAAVEYTKTMDYSG